MADIPVYLVAGFLDGGKTNFINGILEDGFARKDRTLLICCEEGEEEYNPRALDNVTVVTVEEEEDSAQIEETRAVGQATKNAQPLTDTEDEFVYATVKGFERETGIQRAYYYLCGALIIGAVFFLLPSRSKKNHEGRH